MESQNIDRVKLLEEEVYRYKKTLLIIQSWDVLNPPRSDLLHDLPWLKKLVDDTLSGKIIL